jgi:CubicO group peptidase (beta-lactamase class C family)
VYGYGKTSADGPAPDGRTLFEIGSVTKVFTCLALADMVQRQQVTLDEPIQKLLPDTVQVPRYGNQPITLLDLATHTSELPRIPYNLLKADVDPWNLYAHYTVEEMYAFLSGYRLAHAPGRRYAYSNLGMGLLGHGLARRAGTGYEGLVLGRICRPLAMKDTCITLSDPQRKRLAVGHNAVGSPVSNWDLPTLAGAGALRSTADDLLRLVSAHLHPEQTPLADAIESVQLRRREVGKGLSIGLAWHITDESEVRWHNGATGGYASFVAFDRARGMGVVVLSNTTARQIDELGLKLLDLLAGKPVEPFKILQPIPLDPALLDQYVGRYALGDALEINVFRQDDKLMAKVPGQPAFRIFPESETEFFYRVVDAKISFVRDDDGQINKLILHQHGLDLPAWRDGLIGQLSKRLWKGLAKTRQPSDETDTSAPEKPR